MPSAPAGAALVTRWGSRPGGGARGDCDRGESGLGDVFRYIGYAVGFVASATGVAPALSGLRIRLCGLWARVREFCARARPSGEYNAVPLKEMDADEVKDFDYFGERETAEV